MMLYAEGFVLARPLKFERLKGLETSVPSRAAAAEFGCWPPVKNDAGVNVLLFCWLFVQPQRILLVRAILKLISTMVDWPSWICVPIDPRYSRAGVRLWS